MAGPNFSVPPQHVTGLQTLARLSDESADRFIELLRAPLSSISEFRRQVQAVLGGVDGESDNVGSALFAASGMVEGSDWTDAEVVDAIVAMDLLSLSESERSTLRARLSAALGSEGLQRLARGAGLTQEHSAVFADARVLTDLRPVFGRTDPSVIGGFIATHTLKLEYRDEERNAFRCLFVSLDEEDLGRLRLAIDRAMVKADSLRQFVERSDSTMLVFIDEGA